MSDERVLEQARAVWRAAMDRDDAFAALARQRRLAQAVAPRETRRSISGALPLHAVVALGIIALAGWVRGAPSVGAPVSDQPEPVASSSVPTANSAEAPQGGAPSAAQQHRMLVAVTPCFGC
jgi:hypothetical protein